MKNYMYLFAVLLILPVTIMASGSDDYNLCVENVTSSELSEQFRVMSDVLNEEHENDMARCDYGNYASRVRCRVKAREKIQLKSENRLSPHRKALEQAYETCYLRLKDWQDRQLGKILLDYGIEVSQDSISDSGYAGFRSIDFNDDKSYLVTISGKYLLEVKEKRQRFRGVSRKNLTKNITPIDGLYEISHPSTTQILYFKEDVFSGLEADIYDLESKVNLTKVKKKRIRKGMISSMDSKSMIIYESNVKGKKFTVTVFVDLDEPYSKKLIDKLANYNELGIDMRIAAYPRAGEGSIAYKKSLAIWCSKDRHALLNKAMSGATLEVLEVQVANETSVDCSEYVYASNGLVDGFVEKIGLKGIPTIVLEDGTIIHGYVPPESLKSYMNDSN